jgi:nickel-dependent lactate racemase
MIQAQAVAPPGSLLPKDTIYQTIHRGTEGRFAHQKVLVLIPDHTRSLPLPQLFGMLVEVLHDARKLDFMVASGTHPPLNGEQLNSLVGITPAERSTTYKHIGLLNHNWQDRDALIQIGTLPKAQVQEMAGDFWHPTLGGAVPIRINRQLLDYDHIILLGPTFPHEAAGFSGGAKYLFPGISGPEVIDTMHWLGALVGVSGIVGIKDTPTRAMIHAAAEHVPRPITLAALVTVDDGLAGLVIGDYLLAWEVSADLSAKRHILWQDKSFKRVLSWAPPMYDDLWTAGKAVYKLEPVVADGGEVIIYAPHLKEISRMHGEYIYTIGYHVLEYFLKQWDRFEHIPRGVLAHSTNVRGRGQFAGGVEYPRMKVTLSSQVPAEDCQSLSLSYQNPDEIEVEEWENSIDEETLFVPKAGEMLYRLRL